MAVCVDGLEEALVGIVTPTPLRVNSIPFIHMHPTMKTANTGELATDTFLTYRNPCQPRLQGFE
jgi:hypothetical protein